MTSPSYSLSIVIVAESSVVVIPDCNLHLSVIQHRIWFGFHFICRLSPFGFGHPCLSPSPITTLMYTACWLTVVWDVPMPSISTWLQHRLVVTCSASWLTVVNRNILRQLHIVHSVSGLLLTSLCLLTSIHLQLFHLVSTWPCGDCRVCRGLKFLFSSRSIDCGISDIWFWCIDCWPSGQTCLQGPYVMINWLQASRNRQDMRRRDTPQNGVHHSYSESRERYISDFLMTENSEKVPTPKPANVWEYIGYSGKRGLEWS